MRAWWRLQVTAVFLPIAHAVLIATWLAMFSSNKTGFVGALAGVATLALMAKLPGWAAGAAMGLDGGNVVHQVRRTHGYARMAVRTAVAAKTGGASAVARTAVGGALPPRRGGAGGGVTPSGSSGGAAPPG
jgi:TctA family transporter